MTTVIALVLIAVAVFITYLALDAARKTGGQDIPVSPIGWTHDHVRPSNHKSGNHDEL